MGLTGQRCNQNIVYKIKKNTLLGFILTRKTLISMNSKFQRRKEISALYKISRGTIYCINFRKIGSEWTMLPWILLTHQLIDLLFFLFSFQLEASSTEGIPLLFQNLQRQDRASCTSKAWVHDARMCKLNADVLEKPKLALRFLKVYLFFQTQMWPLQCCF